MFRFTQKPSSGVQNYVLSHPKLILLVVLVVILVELVVLVLLIVLTMDVIKRSFEPP
jgi:hypothetical protein